MLRNTLRILVPAFILMAFTACTLDPTDLPGPDPLDTRLSPSALTQSQAVDLRAAPDKCVERGTIYFNRESEECPILVVTARGRLLAPSDIENLPQGLRDGIEVSMSYRLLQGEDGEERCGEAVFAQFYCMTILGFQDRPIDDKQF